MNDQSAVERLCAGEHPVVDVVFVHGLTGDAQETWTDDRGSHCWPVWLSDDLERLCVYTLGYPAGLLRKFAKKEMDMFERAANVLERFAGHGIGDRPLIFVAHSLGGILTKLILRTSSEANDHDWRRVSESTKLVIFISTPHTGAAVANVLGQLPIASKHVKLLANSFGFLEDLNSHYRTLASGREDLSTAVYYETHTTNSVLVVSRESADPGVGGARPVAVDKDHVTICKPADKEDVVYLGVKRRVEKVLARAARVEPDPLALTSEDHYAERSPQDRRDLLQKLIDADREDEYPYANDYQNYFARRYTRLGLLTTAREDHEALLAQVETRFVNHVYHPLICKEASDEEIRAALQVSVIDPVVGLEVGGSRFNARLVLSALYYLTEQCHIRWDRAP